MKTVRLGKTEEKCPYDLPIREMIVENVAFYERRQEEVGRIVEA